MKDYLKLLRRRTFLKDINLPSLCKFGFLAVCKKKEFALTWCLQIIISTLPSSLKILHLGVNQIALTNQIINQNLSQLTYLNLSSNREINSVSQACTFLNSST